MSSFLFKDNYRQLWSIYRIFLHIYVVLLGSIIQNLTLLTLGCHVYLTSNLPPPALPSLHRAETG